MTIDTHEFLEVERERIEWVNNFKYLGSMIVSTDSDIRTRKGQAWGAFWKIKSQSKSKIVPLPLKINIFKAAVLAILLYGCESWILTENLEKSLNSFATNCYRIMLNIRRLDKKRNEDIYKMVAQEPLAVIVQQRQLRFLGHCLRKDEEELINKYVIYEAMVRGIEESRECYIPSTLGDWLTVAIPYSERDKTNGARPNTVETNRSRLQTFVRSRLMMMMMYRHTQIQWLNSCMYITPLL